MARKPSATEQKGPTARKTKAAAEKADIKPARKATAEKPATTAKKKAVATKAAAAVTAKARSRTTTAAAKPESLQGVPGRLRAIIEGVAPQVDCGRFPVKRVVGEEVRVEADVFTDGHDKVTADLWYRYQDEQEWRRLPMTALVNDRWYASFPVEQLGRYHYTLSAWTDHFETWRYDLKKRYDADQELTIPFAIGVRFAREAASRARGDAADAKRLKDWADQLDKRSRDPEQQLALGLEETYRLAMDTEIAQIIRRYPDPDTVKRFEKELTVVVERERARFSSWYEFFPRSAGQPGRHGSFKDAEKRLEYVAQMGFDVVYFPPIHPIGEAFRKGKNNAVSAEPDDVGSPWAIGAEEGGHKAIHPELGTLEDFRRLVEKARQLDMEIALDIAFQASPDHPYVKEHPQWFLMRPDGTIQYAENPPKKYQDIYPFHFESEDWPALWAELKSVFEFWIEQGVTIFRVDNPHTKSFRFWEWCITELKREHPELIFLSEAFTRPKVMHRLAKLGYSQSYTYFTWRNTKQELIEYFTELSQEEGREYFRPNVWPNTPDILPDSLQVGGRPAHVIRLILAATLSANYGIYGPTFELYDNRPRAAGAEEYLDSEKYQLREWNLKQAGSLKDLIAKLNGIRRRYPALQRDWGLRFHPIDNEQLLAYSKVMPGGEDAVIVVVNLDVHHDHSGWLTLPLEHFGLEPNEQYQVEDLLSGARYIWQGPSNYVALSPHGQSAHILRLKRRVHREQDFPYYM
jgi:starch synthase (maltosyl-transferring)